MQTAGVIDGRLSATATPSERGCMLSPSMAIHDRATDYQTDPHPLTTLRDATDRPHATRPDRTIPAKFLLRKTPTAAWIAMIVAELHWDYDARTLDWFPPESM